MEKAREFQKNINLCFTDCATAFDCMDHKKLWKILKDGNTKSPLFVSKEVERCMQINMQQLEPDTEQLIGSKLGKECGKVVYFHPILFNFYSEYIIRNARLKAS